jgi:putative membrane protein
MKQMLLAGAACALVLSACSQERSPEPVDKAQDAIAAPVGQVAATVSATTVAGYVPAAVMGDMYEIQAADIALQRSQNADVKALAAAIKTDHTAASNAFRALLRTAAPGETAPAALDQRRQGMLDNLRSASAATFDATWLDQQIAAHNEALTLQRGFSDQGSPLAAHARSVVPKIERHLQEAQRIKAAM